LSFANHKRKMAPAAQIEETSLNTLTLSLFGSQIPFQTGLLVGQVRQKTPLFSHSLCNHKYSLVCLAVGPPSHCATRGLKTSHTCYISFQLQRIPQVCHSSSFAPGKRQRQTYPSSFIFLLSSSSSSPPLQMLAGPQRPRRARPLSSTPCPWPGSASMLGKSVAC